MKLILGYSRYGIELDVNKDTSKEEMIKAYLAAYGGPQGVIDHFLKHVSFVEDTIKDINIENKDEIKKEEK